MTTVGFSMQLPFRLTKDGKWYVASCPPLDVHSQGKTPAKAKENLGEALSLFLLSCFERGTLDTVLKDCGFQAAKGKVRGKKRPQKDHLEVPIPLLVTQSKSHECHA